MKPVVDGLQSRFGDKVDFVVYANVNADQEISQFAFDQGVEYVPTMMLVDAGGAELKRWIGAVSEGELEMALGEAAP